MKNFTCESCDNCCNCVDCKHCQDCDNCLNCTNCENCVDCENCHDCVGLVGQTNQNAVVRPVQAIRRKAEVYEETAKLLEVAAEAGKEGIQMMREMNVYLKQQNDS